MPPVTTWKKHMGTITFLTLPENFFVVLLFYCSWGKISQSEWTFWAYFQRTLVPRKTVFLRKLCARKVQVIEDGLWAQYNNLQGLVFIPNTRNYCFWIWNRKEKIKKTMFSWSKNAWSKYTQSSNISDEECFLPTTATKTWQSELFSATLLAEWRHSAGSLAITPFGFQRLLWSGHSTFITGTQSTTFSCRHSDSSSNLSDKSPSEWVAKPFFFLHLIQSLVK